MITFSDSMGMITFPDRMGMITFSGPHGKGYNPLMQTGLSMPVIMTADEVPLRYAVCGSGQSIVFVLGYGMTLDEWPARLISHLARSYRIILYNHRGVSGERNPGVEFTIPQGARDLHQVIARLAGTPEDSVHIVGYSMGGMIALEYAVLYPGSADRLVLINTDCGGVGKVPAEEWVTEEMGREHATPEAYLDLAGRLLLTESFRNAHPDPARWFPDYGEVADPHAVREQFDAMLLWEGVCTKLHTIRSRTLILTGDQDIVIPPENAEILAAAIPDATLHILSGQAHGMIFCEPEKIAEMIEEFIG